MFIYTKEKTHTKLSTMVSPRKRGQRKIGMEIFHILNYSLWTECICPPKIYILKP